MSVEKEYKCTECGKVFNHKCTLIAHLRIHTGERPFQCPTCPSRFVQSGHLKEHIRTHTGERPYQCSTCGKAFINGSHLRSHMRMHSNTKTEEGAPLLTLLSSCVSTQEVHNHNNALNTVCPTDQGKGKSVIPVKKKCLETGRRYTCDLCGAAFKAKRNLKVHLVVHSGQRPHVCNICFKDFTQASHLRFHNLTHKAPSSHSCEVCGVKCSSATHARKHAISHHINTSANSDVLYKCTVCSKNFTKLERLKTHMQRHTGEKIFKCGICGRSFGESAMLVSHMRTHTGEKPFKCTICPKSFRQRSVLRCHLLMHAGDRRYVCDVCHKRFISQSDVVKHSRSHTKEKPFACQFCNSCFSRSNHLSRHVKIHFRTKKPTQPINIEDAVKSGSMNDEKTNDIIPINSETNNENLLADNRVLKNSLEDGTGSFLKVNNLFGYFETIERTSMKTVHSSETFLQQSTCIQQENNFADFHSSLGFEQESRVNNFVIDDNHPEEISKYNFDLYDSPRFQYEPNNEMRNKESGSVFSQNVPQKVEKIMIPSTEAKLKLSYRWRYPNTGAHLKNSCKVASNRMTDNSKPWQCGICDVSFKEQSQLKEHINEHKIVMPSVKYTKLVKNPITGVLNEKEVTPRHAVKVVCKEIVEPLINAHFNKQSKINDPQINLAGEETITQSNINTIRFNKAREYNGEEYPETVRVYANDDESEYPRNVRQYINEVVEYADEVREYPNEVGHYVTAVSEYPKDVEVAPYEGDVVEFAGNIHNYGAVTHYNGDGEFNDWTHEQQNFRDTVIIERQEYFKECVEKSVVVSYESNNITTEIHGYCDGDVEASNTYVLPEYMHEDNHDQVHIPDALDLTANYVYQHENQAIKQSVPCQEVISIQQYNVNNTQTVMEPTNNLYNGEENEYIAVNGYHDPNIHSTNNENLTYVYEQENNVEQIPVHQEEHVPVMEDIGQPVEFIYEHKKGFLAQRMSLLQNENIAINNRLQSNIPNYHYHNKDITQYGKRNHESYLYEPKNDGADNHYNNITNLREAEPNLNPDDEFHSEFQMNMNCQKGSDLINKMPFEDQENDEYVINETTNKPLEYLSEDSCVDGDLRNHLGSIDQTNEALCQSDFSFLNHSDERSMMEKERCVSTAVAEEYDKYDNEVLLEDSYDNIDSLPTINPTTQELQENISNPLPLESNAKSVIKKCETHKVIKEFPCEECHKVFKNARLLSVHMCTHSGERKYACDECPRRFIQSAHLNDHKLTHSNQNNHQCEVCGKRFNRIQHLKNHSLIHTDQKDFKCEECGKSFRFRNGLIVHQKTHSEEASYKCEACGRDFKHLTTLISHRRLHTGTKLYACSICLESFSQISTLSKHLRIHSDSRPYACDECSKAFRSTSDLNRHKVTHSGLRKYACLNGECQKTFTRKSHLDRHQSTHKIVSSVT